MCQSPTCSSVGHLLNPWQFRNHMFAQFCIALFTMLFFSERYPESESWFYSSKNSGVFRVVRQQHRPISVLLELPFIWLTHQKDSNNVLYSVSAPPTYLSAFLFIAPAYPPVMQNQGAVSFCDYVFPSLSEQINCIPNTAYAKPKRLIIQDALYVWCQKTELETGDGKSFPCNSCSLAPVKCIGGLSPIPQVRRS